jgi:hypothetical protein
MEKLTDGPVGLGTKYRAQWKGSPYVEMETIAYDRPHSWTMHNGGPIEVMLTCRLEPIPEGTRVHGVRAAPARLVSTRVSPLPRRHTPRRSSEYAPHPKRSGA